MGQVRARLAAERHTDLGEGGPETSAAAYPRCHDPWEAFAEGVLGAGGVATGAAPGLQDEGDRAATAGQVPDPALEATMDLTGDTSATRAAGGALGRGHDQGAVAGGGAMPDESQASQVGEEGGKTQGKLLRERG